MKWYSWMNKLRHTSLSDALISPHFFRSSIRRRYRYISGEWTTTSSSSDELMTKYYHLIALVFVNPMHVHNTRTRTGRSKLFWRNSSPVAKTLSPFRNICIVFLQLARFSKVAVLRKANFNSFREWKKKQRTGMSWSWIPYQKLPNHRRYVPVSNALRHLLRTKPDTVYVCVSFLTVDGFCFLRTRFYL